MKYLVYYSATRSKGHMYSSIKEYVLEHVMVICRNNLTKKMMKCAHKF